MDKETYETLKRLTKLTRNLLAYKYGKRKRLRSDELWEKSTTLRDLVDIENWIDEAEKDIT